MSRFVAYVWMAMFAVAVVGFALAAHREAWAAWRWAMLALAGVGRCGGWATLERPLTTVLGKVRSSHPWQMVLVMACLGVVLAIAYCRLLAQPAFPSSIRWFAVAAAGIGLTEELLWRGWMQGALTGPLGWLTATLLAAAAHTAYKAALFVFPPAGEPPLPAGSLWFLVGCTFGVGVVLGLSRVRQGTIAPAVAFHVVFDLVVYGSRATAPWWVW